MDPPGRHAAQTPRPSLRRWFLSFSLRNVCGLPCLLCASHWCRHPKDGGLVYSFFWSKICILGVFFQFSAVCFFFVSVQFLLGNVFFYLEKLTVSIQFSLEVNFCLLSIFLLEKGIFLESACLHSYKKKGFGDFFCIPTMQEHSFPHFSRALTTFLPCFSHTLATL